MTEQGRLKRSVGFYGLMFVSLGSIIGSGWLLGALNAAEEAGPASILSWLLAAAMLAVAGTIAVAVYEIVGLAILRRAWFNLDRVWAAALITAGAVTLVTAL